MPDDPVLRHYEAGQEDQRLARGLGQLELVRTQEILRRHLPPPPARVLDVGGGPGVHAAWLLDAGYDVHLLDVAPLHVEQARTALGARGLTAELGDARSLPVNADRFDVALLLGPLYHLVERADRLAALHEARRVVHPGGVVAVAAISRFASLHDGLGGSSCSIPISERSSVATSSTAGTSTLATIRTGSRPPSSIVRSELHEEIAAAGLSIIELSAWKASPDGSATSTPAGPTTTPGRSSSRHAAWSRPSQRCSG